MATRLRRPQPKPPILPRDFRDPTGQDALERRAMQDFRGRIRRILRAYREAVDRFSPELVVNARYAYRLEQATLATVLGQLGYEVDSVLLEGGETSLWFFNRYVEVAATRGLAAQFANLSLQTPAYREARGSVGQILNSDAYQRRRALLQAREFEEMKGLAGSVKADMARVLTDGMSRGLNPLEIGRNLTEQAGIEERRAERIARTEVSTAYKRARWDEADDAADESGMQTREMHLSALSPTTRATHAARHAKLFTTDQLRDWYSVDGNAINCKCGSTTVLVDAEGKPLVPGIQARARATLEKQAARGYAWAEDDGK